MQYTNTGDLAMPAPLLIFTASRPDPNNKSNLVQGAWLTMDPTLQGIGVWSSAAPAGFSHSVQILASGSTPGYLEPGDSFQVPVYYAGWLSSQWFTNPIYYHVGVVDATDTTAVDWSSQESSLQPASISTQAWDAIYPNIAAQLGNTWGQYVARLDGDVQYLGSLGENVTDISKLWFFEIQQANGITPLSTLASATDAQMAAPGMSLDFSRSFGPTILQRNQFGRFGWGWSDPWQTSLTTQSDGTVIIDLPGGGRREFQPDLRGGYHAQPGDYGTLTTLTGGGYMLTEQNGQMTVYNADGSLDYVQDTDGNRITAGYTNGLLTSLTHSSGQSLTLTYNAAGLVSTISDSAGRTTTYSYDSSNQYLLSVRYFDGRTTSYTYDTGSNLENAHALLSITHPDGSHDYYTYNSQGWLADAHRDGGVEDTTFTYNAGQVSAKDALGDTSTYSFDGQGELAAVENPFQNTARFAYDNNQHLVQIVDPAGQVYSSTYNAQGDLTSSTNPLGNTVRYAYTSRDDRLASATDPSGNSTLFGYDGQGDLTSTTYADGTIERAAYDPTGNVLSVTNRRGQPIHYTYDAAGSILTKTFADGSQVVYTYDSHENLTSATDATGITSLTYDANDRLTQITYPSGRYLKYTYDGVGRRTQMVDQDGFTVNYAYDSLGRLATLTDGSGNLIVRYTYDTIGRLSREDKGNGTYTAYAYLWEEQAQSVEKMGFPSGSFGALSTECQFAVAA